MRILEALLVSTGVVALAEIGDKTQLLALLLATRFRKPVPIVLRHLRRHAREPCFRERGGQLAGAASSAPTRCAGSSACRSSRWRCGAHSGFAARRIRGRAALRRVPHDRRRFLPGRDGRQDADRDGRARRAIPLDRLGGARHHARDDARQRARGVSRRRDDPARARSRRCAWSPRSRSWRSAFTCCRPD